MNELTDALNSIPEDWNGAPMWRKPVLVLLDAARKVANPDYEAAINTFWAHATDLLAPTVYSTGIDRAVELAVKTALGITEDE